MIKLEEQLEGQRGYCPVCKKEVLTYILSIRINTQIQTRDIFIGEGRNPRPEEYDEIAFICGCCGVLFWRIGEPKEERPEETSPETKE